MTFYYELIFLEEKYVDYFFYVNLIVPYTLLKKD